VKGVKCALVRKNRSGRHPPSVKVKQACLPPAHRIMLFSSSGERQRVGPSEAALLLVARASSSLRDCCLLAQL